MAMLRKNGDMNFKKVTKEQFDLFVQIYPEKLDYHVTHICEPPLGSYNDFSVGKKWPDSMVAKIVLNESMKGHPAYHGEPNDYFIINNSNAK